MSKKFTMLLASLFLVMGTAWAQTATEHADGLYKIYWEWDKRGYLAYHDTDYPNSPQLAGVVNHNPNGHYQLTDAGINLGWYLYTSPKTGKSYLFEATTGKFITFNPANFNIANSKQCLLSEEVSDYAMLNLLATDNGSAPAFALRYVHNGTNYQFCSGCGSNKGQNPVRFATNGQDDGGIPFKFVEDNDALTITDEVKNAAIAKITGHEKYFPVNIGTRTSNDRRVKTISLASNLSASNTANATTLTHDGNGLKYVDMTETVTMKAYANEPVTAAVSLYSGNWIHAYVYIDLAQDGFTAGVGTDGYTPTGDLMTYSCYSINTQNWYNKDGAVANNNTLVMPEFHAPTTPGTYRMRFKTDWNDLQPDGSGAQFVSAWGTIVDVTLVVEEAPTTCTVKYDFVYDSEVKYSQENLMQYVGAAYPEITVTHPYGVVSAAKPTGVIDGNEAVGGVITKEIALSVQGLPFEFSESYANAVWYYMPLHHTGKHYLSYTDGQEYIPLGNDKKVLPADGHDAYLWAFVGDPFTGYKIMNKAAGETKILSSSTTMTNGDGATYPLMIVEASLPEGNNTYWIPSASSHATNGFFLAQKGYSNNRMNIRNEKLAYWTGGADGGSTFRVTTIADDTDFENIASLKAVAGKVGYPKLNSNEYTALAGWEQGRTTKLDAEVAISNFKKSSNIVLPEDGKAYTIANFSHYNGGTTRHLNYTKDAALSVKEEGEPSVFVCKMLSNGAYTFVTEDGKVLTWMHSNDGYKGDGAFRGYSENYATEYNNYSDWNRITVKKNGTTENDFGHLRLVARRYARDNEPNSSFIIQGNNGNWDRAGDSYFLQTPQVDSRCFSSAWILTEVEHANTDAENLAIAKIGALDVRYELLAEGIGGYHYVVNGAVCYSKADAKSAVHGMTSVDEVNNLAATFAINQPAAGFYRVKSMNGNDVAKKGKYWQVNSDETRMELNATAHDYNSILYVADNTILSYGSGLYVNNYYNPAAIGTEARTWVISENNAITGTYALYQRKDDGTVDGYCLSDWTGDATYGQNDANAAWIFEEIVSLPVTISNAQVTFDGNDKYVSTLFIPVALNIPDGITAYIGVNEDNYLAMEPLENIIPANTGVILMANEAKTYDFTISAEAGTAIEAGNNIITGTTAKAIITPEDVTCYILANDTEDGVGLYKAMLNKNTSGEADAENGTSFINNAFKAYIPVPKAEQPQAAKALTMRLGRGSQGGTTSIESSELNAQGAQLIYDLQGRRVLNPTKGMYIVNGKKMVIK